MDFVNDNNPLPLYEATALVTRPDYVGQSEVITPDNLAELDAVAFADPDQREPSVDVLGEAFVDPPEPELAIDRPLALHVRHDVIGDHDPERRLGHQWP